MNLYTDLLSIGEVSELTGVKVATLRAWQTRYGFPVPQRLPGGHRRFTGRDVEAIQRVIADRDGGATLETALRHAQDSLGPRSSILAGVRHALPHVSPVTYSVRTMLAISRAIEDEAAGHSADAFLIGAFQEVMFFRRAEPRWKDLARGASLAVALAQFPTAGRPALVGGVWRVPLAGASPLTREWAVVCEAPTFSAALVGAELPGGTARTKRYDAFWTVEPMAVRAAARVAGDAAIAAVPELAELVGPRLQMGVMATAASLRSATILTNRIVQQLQGG